MKRNCSFGILAFMALCCCIGLIGCDKYQPDKLEVEKQFRLLEVDMAGLAADGSSTVDLVVEKTVDTDKDLQVVFVVAPGAMVFSTVKFQGDRALGKLKLAQEGGAYTLQVSVKDGDRVLWKKDTLLNVGAALPDRLRLEVDKTSYVVAPGGTLVLKTFLERQVGKVSPGRVVDFRAFQLGLAGDTSFVGAFKNVSNNRSTAEQVLADVTLMTDGGDIDTLKQLYVQGRTTGNGQLVLRSQIVLPYRKK